MENHITQQVLFLLVIFTLISLQILLGYFFQIRQYQRTIKKWLGKGILGVGQRRGLFFSGEILVLAYNPEDNKIITVQTMRGYTIFASFKEKKEYIGLSLEKLRLHGEKEDLRDFRLLRFLFRYKPEKPTKWKGALIQAVEGVENHLRSTSRTSAIVNKPVYSTAQTLMSESAMPEEIVLFDETRQEISAFQAVSPVERTLVSEGSGSEGYRTVIAAKEVTSQLEALRVMIQTPLAEKESDG